MSDLVKIPEDMKELYELAKGYNAGVAYSIGHLPKTGEVTQLTTLIERIAQQDAEIEMLKFEQGTANKMAAVDDASLDKLEATVETLKGLLRECRSWIVGATYGYNEPIDLLLKIDQQLNARAEAQVEALQRENERLVSALKDCQAQTLADMKSVAMNAAHEAERAASKWEKYMPPSWREAEALLASRATQPAPQEGKPCPDCGYPAVPTIPAWCKLPHKSVTNQ
jgi:hypothetical protein